MRLIILLLFLSLAAASQTDSVYYGLPPEQQTERKEKGDREWLKKFNYAANFQLFFGRVSYVFLSPSIGFSPIEKVNLGLGFIYNFISTDIGYYGRFRQSVFGGHSYLRYLITDNYFLQAQYDKIRQPDLFSLAPGEKVWVDYVLAGGGFRRPIGDHAALSSTLMYNITHHPLSIYPSRLILQFGFVAGF